MTGSKSAVQGTDGGDYQPPVGTGWPTERQIAFTFAHNLLTNPGDAERLTEVFMYLYEALDEDKISRLQGTLQIVLDPATGEEVSRRLERLGIRTSVRDL